MAAALTLIVRDGAPLSQISIEVGRSALVVNIQPTRTDISADISPASPSPSPSPPPTKGSDSLTETDESSKTSSSESSPSATGKDNFSSSSPAFVRRNFLPPSTEGMISSRSNTSTDSSVSFMSPAVAKSPSVSFSLDISAVTKSPSVSFSLDISAVTKSPSVTFSPDISPVTKSPSITFCWSALSSDDLDNVSDAASNHEPSTNGMDSSRSHTSTDLSVSFSPDISPTITNSPSITLVLSATSSDDLYNISDASNSDSLKLHRSTNSSNPSMQLFWSPEACSSVVSYHQSIPIGPQGTNSQIVLTNAQNSNELITNREHFVPINLDEPSNSTDTVLPRGTLPRQPLRRTLLVILAAILWILAAIILILEPQKCSICDVVSEGFLKETAMMVVFSLIVIPICACLVISFSLYWKPQGLELVWWITLLLRAGFFTLSLYAASSFKDVFSLVVAALICMSTIPICHIVMVNDDFGLFESLMAMSVEGGRGWLEKTDWKWLLVLGLCTVLFGLKMYVDTSSRRILELVSPYVEKLAVKGEVALNYIVNALKNLVNPFILNVLMVVVQAMRTLVLASFSCLARLLTIFGIIAILSVLTGVRGIVNFLKLCLVWLKGLEICLRSRLEALKVSGGRGMGE